MFASGVQVVQPMVRTILYARKSEKNIDVTAKLRLFVRSSDEMRCASRGCRGRRVDHEPRCQLVVWDGRQGCVEANRKASRGFSLIRI
jgi:hypothetical protein